MKTVATRHHRSALTLAFFLLTLLALLLPSQSRAQIIWGTAQTWSGDPAQVLANGTRHAAVGFMTNDVTVNGVTFDRPAVTSTVSPVTFANGSTIQVTSTFFQSQVSAPPVAGDYDTLVSFGNFHLNATSTITLGGLVAGQTYQVQVFMPYWDNSYPTTFASSGGGAATPALDVGRVSPSAIAAPFITGTFTATGTSHVIDYRSSPTGGWAGVSAISVRNVTPVLTGLVIPDVTVKTTSQWSGPTAGRKENMINGSGLSVGGSDETKTHDADATGNNVWHGGPDEGGMGPGATGNPPLVADQVVEFDLGANYDLTGAHVWNMNQSGYPGRGVKDVEILVSSATTGAFTPLTTTRFAQDTNAPGLVAQVVPFTGATNVRRVRFAIQSAWSGLESEYVGLSEVRFQGTAAVPATPPILVTNISDSGPGSLRAAIDYANATAGADTITFSDGSGGTVNFTDATPEIIDLATVLPDLSTDITISGPGADKLTIRRPATSPQFSIFFVSSTATVSLSGLTLTGGDTINSGGGIRNDGTLTVTACAITGNTASNGGGISSENNLTVHSSTISGNTAIRGGGVYSSTSGFTAASTVTHLVNTTLSGNTATTRGGGFHNNNGLSYLVNCTLTGNSAQANQGGGVATVGNTSTVTRFANTLCVGNTGGDVDYFFGPTNSNISLGGSLIGTGNSIANFTGQTTAAAASTILNTTLASNGGPTLTHALIPGSPALNAGVNANATNPTDAIFGDANDVALTTDQRGSTFLRAFGTVDIGAFEEQPVPNTAPVIATYGTAHSLNFAENSTTPVLDLEATDSDLPAQNLTWSLSGTDAPLFSINSSGVLTFNAAPDFETKSSYAVTVTVTDNATPTAATDSVALTITITNVNEMPSFTKGANQNLPASTATAQSVANWATAIHDGDSSVTQTLTFNVSNDNNGLFTIQPALAADGTLNYTPSGAGGTASVMVTLTDDASINGTAALTTAAQTFTITVASPPPPSGNVLTPAVITTSQWSISSDGSKENMVNGSGLSGAGSGREPAA